MKLIRHSLWAALGLGAFAGPQLHAQTPPAAPADSTVTLPSFEVSTTQDKGYRAANSVSATRIATPIADLPFSISAFTQQFIEDTGPADLYDIVKYAAGVSAGGQEFDGGIDTFVIRGFKQTPERDGFNETGQGNAYVDPVNIERVEVVKGPAALLYGQVAPGGLVNYITKQPEDHPFTVVNVGFGSFSYNRDTIDYNQPLIGNTLLFRFNGAFQNGFEFENIQTSSKTTVLSPSLKWNVSKTLTIKANYQYFYRHEAPAQVYPLNTEVATPQSIVNSLNAPFGAPSAALPSKTGVDAAAGFNDSADPGFGGVYPGLPANFDYDNEKDYRHTRDNTFNLEADLTLGDHWLARSNFDYNKNYSDFNQTGIGDIYLAPPGSLIFTPGAGWAVSPSWAALTAAQQLAQELAFGQAILKDEGASLATQTNASGTAVGNPAIIPRRPRMLYVYGHNESAEVDLAGDYAFSWGKIKPLVGASYDASWLYSLTYLNTGTSAASPYYQTWDVDPNSPTYFIDHNPANTLPPSKYTNFTGDGLAHTLDEAVYAVINGSFFNDRLFTTMGARYNQSRSISTNFIGTSVAAIYPPGFKADYTTPQFGVGFKITPDSMLYASYSTSYQFSGGFTTTPELVNGAEVAVNTGSIKPVTSEGEEIGYKTDFFGGKFSSTFAVYRIVQSDGTQGVNTIFPTGTLSTTVQGVDVRSQGVEYELTWSPIDNLQLFGSISEDDVRNVKEPLGNLIYLGVHPNFTAKTLGNMWARYNFTIPALRGLWVGGGFNYAGKTNGNTADPYLIYAPYLLWNSAVGYDWTWKKSKYSAIFNWYNMTNKAYQPVDQEEGLPSRVTVALKIRL